MKYSEWIDLQFGKAIVKAVRDNASGKISIVAAATQIAKANATARRKHAWLKSHPEAENAHDERGIAEDDSGTANDDIWGY